MIVKFFYGVVPTLYVEWGVEIIHQKNKKKPRGIRNFFGILKKLCSIRWELI